MAEYKSTNSLSPTDAAYIAGLIDGEGTISLTRRHKNERRQLVISISNTELELLDYALKTIGAGKITGKRKYKAHHSTGFTYSISNRQALALLEQIQPFLRSYKSERAELVLSEYLRLTPRNGKYSDKIIAERAIFEEKFLQIKAVTI
ncbi:MAG: LAGLIDADG family homing endonuclease [Sedimenticola sp.]